MRTTQKYIALGTKSQCIVAEELTNKIKAAIFDYSGQIPLALVIGVLRIVEQEILEAQDDDDYKRRGER